MGKTEKDKHTYIFIHGSTNSGTTLLSDIICTSKNVSFFEHPNRMSSIEGKHISSEFMPTVSIFNNRLFTEEKKFCNQNNFDWVKIKERWFQFWKNNSRYKEGCILLEKTPVELMYANMIEKEFDQPFHIMIVRNPYATIEGIRRTQNGEILKWNKDHPTDKSVPLTSLERIINHWVKTCEYILINTNRLKNTKIIRYGSIVNDPKRTCETLQEWIPYLGELNHNKNFEANGYNKKIHNRNPIQIKRLSKNDILCINKILYKHKNIMDMFKYKYIEI